MDDGQWAITKAHLEKIPSNNEVKKVGHNFAAMSRSDLDLHDRDPNVARDTSSTWWSFLYLLNLT